MPKTIPHRELRNNSCEILREVQSGETFLITNNGKVVAMLTPAQTAPAAEIPVRRARIIGGFDTIESIPAVPAEPVDETLEETINYLRGDR